MPERNGIGVPGRRMETRHFLHRLMAVCALGAVLAAPAEVGARARLYNLDILLNQPHPFATAPNFRAAGHAPVPQLQIRQPMRMPLPTGTTPRTRPAAAPVPPVYRAARLMTDTGGRSGARILSEIRFGVFAHDQGPFSRNEEDGVDFNFELLFTSPAILDRIWAPRPHFGATVNGSGDTSQVYLGLTWEWPFGRDWYLDFSLGGAAHDGKTKTNRIDRKELGCRVLFRQSIELGYRFGTRHAISAFLDHVSNANICDKNEGLESLGVRYGYRY